MMPPQHALIRVVAGLLTLLASLITFPPGSDCAAQEADSTATVVQEPEAYQLARQALAAGDTLTALSRLREVTDSHAGYAAGWSLLGQILTERAGDELELSRDRVEAEKALRTAWRLEPDNPVHYIALGKLMRKQSMPFDSRRVLMRASKLLEDDPEAVSEEEQTSLWYLLGLNYEDVYLDTRNLVFVPNLPVQTPDCAGLGTFCLNFTRPAEFNQHFRNAADLSDEGEEEYERMMFAFRRALDLSPTHPGAFRRLVAHLIEGRGTREALDLARRYRERAPDRPWGHLALGLIYHRLGQDSLAQEAFNQGIAQADSDLAAHYRDVSSLLREELAEEYLGANAETRRWMEQVLWRKSDPLYLTDANEVHVAHLARVSFADLWFEDPQTERWGAETERGQIYIRYGPPERIWQVQREGSREMTAGAFDVSESSGRGGGRWIFWNYDWELPNFIFQKRQGFRGASHMISTASKALEEGARAAVPARYSTSFELLDYPVQVARFRGETDSLVEVEFYSEVPGRELLEEQDTLDLGLFLFTGQEDVEVYRRKLQAPMPPRPTALTFSIPLPGGRFRYSLEARAPGGNRAAAGRGSLEVEPFRDGLLSLSDLVLADAVTPRGRTVEDRDDFAIRVNRRGIFDADVPLGVYWEVYGLATDDRGFANYEVRVRVTDAEGEGVLARIAGALGFGEDDDIELSYERVVEFNGQRVPEYLSVELPGREPGIYRLRIDVVDFIAGAEVTASRTFRIGEVPEPE